MSRALEYDNSLTSVFGIMTKHSEDFARSTKMSLCVDQLDNTEIRTVLYHRNGAEEHHVTRDDNNRVIAIFTRNLKTGAAKL